MRMAIGGIDHDANACAHGVTGLDVFIVLRVEALLATRRGASLKLGRMAGLVIDGVDLVVPAWRSLTFDPEPFLAVGINVRYTEVWHPSRATSSGPGSGTSTPPSSRPTRPVCWPTPGRSATTIESGTPVAA